MDDAVALGQRIRQARLDKGLSLGQLASAVGRSSSSVRRWERGEVAPAKGIIPELAAALELDPSELEAMRPTPISEHSVETPTPAPVVDGPEPTDVLAPKTEAFAAVGGQSAVRPQRGGLFGDAYRAVFAAKSSWIGWTRGVLTAVVLIAMVVVLVWAMGQLLDALGQILDSFDFGGA